MSEPTPQEQAFVDFLEAADDLDRGIAAGLSNLNRSIYGRPQPFGWLRCRLFGHRWEGRFYPYCPRCNEIRLS